MSGEGDKMTTVFVVWMVLVLAMVGLFLVGGVLTAVAGSSIVWFLLAAALLAAAVFFVLKGMERLEQLEEQLQNQSRRIQKLEAQLEQWKKENSDQGTRCKRRVSPCGANSLGRSRAARCAAPTEWSGAARPGGRALHGMESRGQVGLGPAPTTNNGADAFFS